MTEYHLLFLVAVGIPATLLLVMRYAEMRWYRNEIARIDAEQSRD